MVTQKEKRRLWGPPYKIILTPREAVLCHAMSVGLDKVYDSMGKQKAARIGDVLWLDFSPRHTTGK